MDGLTLFERVRQLSDLSDAELKLAKYFEDSYPIVDNIMTISELTGVSSATISRFVKHKLGYDNFIDMRNSADLQLKKQMYHAPIDKFIEKSPTTGGYGYIEHLQTCIHNLSETLTKTDSADFDLAVKLLVEARSVYTVGGASSEMISNLMSIYLKYIRSNVYSVDYDSSMLGHNLIDITNDDVLVVIAYSRVCKKSYNTTLCFSEAGGKVILISDTMNKILKPYVEVILPVIAGGTPMFNTKITALAMAESLCYAMMMYCKESLTERGKKIEKLFKLSGMYANA